MTMTQILWVIMIVISIKRCESANILGLFPAPMLSHQSVFKPLTQQLAKIGHQVTVVTCLSIANDEKLDNYTEIDLTYLAIELKNKLFQKELNKIIDTYDQFKATLTTAFKLVDYILKSKEMRELVKHHSFDLILIEDCTKSALILSHLFKAPVVFISSFGGSFETFETVGGLVHPILYPLATRKSFQNLSTWSKIGALVNEYRLQKMHIAFIEWQDEINKKEYGPNTPTIDELKKNVQMIFLNVHSIWDSNRPVPPNVIYLGGLHLNTPKELPRDLKLSLDSSLRGAIYVSFGTTVDFSIFSKKNLQIFISAFSKLPYDVYWRWNNETLPQIPKNVKTANWFPQSDVLHHPNVKLFITQGGLQSTDEAIAAGVPLIGLPILFDQWFNVDKYVQLKIGVQLDLETITEEEIINAVETVIGDKSYYNNIVKLRKIMFDSQQTSLDRAVWWIEYVLRHGAEHLRTPAANMSWTDYYEVKIILWLLVILLIAVLSIVMVLKKMLKFLFIKYHSNKTKTH